MRTFYVYILRCADNSYYTGITNDIERRMQEHSEGSDIRSYTFSRRPVEIVFCEEFNEPNQAIEFEKQIKGWSRKKKEALIERNWNKISKLAICKNKTNYLNYKKE